MVAITVVRPGATPIRNRLVGEAGCTRATLGSADMMVAAGCGRRSSTPVPACTEMGWLECRRLRRGRLGPRCLRQRRGGRHRRRCRDRAIPGLAVGVAGDGAEQQQEQQATGVFHWNVTSLRCSPSMT